MEFALLNTAWTDKMKWVTTENPKSLDGTLVLLHIDFLEAYGISRENENVIAVLTHEEARDLLHTEDWSGSDSGVTVDLSNTISARVKRLEEEDIQNKSAITDIAGLLFME